MVVLATTAQLIQATAAILSACLASTALFYSMVAYTKNLKISHYNELDKAYQTLLNIALQNPYFLKPEEITAQDQKDKYNIYAFMVWNFLEAIYDKCQKDKYLLETWGPIIEVEGKLHFSWFLREDNKPKFKDVFYQYVLNLINR